MKVTYHAWISENIGLEEEVISIGESACTIQQILMTLCGQSRQKKQVFSDLSKIYIAVNNNMIHQKDIDTIKISEKDMVSFFPAISGG